MHLFSLCFRLTSHGGEPSATLLYIVMINSHTHLSGLVILWMWGSKSTQRADAYDSLELPVTFSVVSNTSRNLLVHEWNLALCS